MQGHIKRAEARLITSAREEAGTDLTEPKAEVAERRRRSSSSLPPGAIADEGDIRMGRRLLTHLLVSSTRKAGKAKDQMGFFAEDLVGLAKAPRGIDLHAVACRLQAGLYSATGG